MITLSDIKRLLQPLYRRIMLLGARATVENSDDTGSVQKVQISALQDEVLDDVERYGAYGFASRPKPGAAAIALFLGGNRNNGVVIATEDATCRKKGLQPGEVALYTDEGDEIYFQRGHNIAIANNSGAAINLTISGNVTINNNGSVTVSGTGDVVAGGISLKNHTHSGVQTGGGVSGPPVAG